MWIFVNITIHARHCTLFSLCKPAIKYVRCFRVEVSGCECGAINFRTIKGAAEYKTYRHNNQLNCYLYCPYVGELLPPIVKFLALFCQHRDNITLRTLKSHDNAASWTTLCWRSVTWYRHKLPEGTIFLFIRAQFHGGLRTFPGFAFTNKLFFTERKNAAHHAKGLLDLGSLSSSCSEFDEYYDAKCSPSESPSTFSGKSELWRWFEAC